MNRECHENIVAFLHFAKRPPDAGEGILGTEVAEMKMRTQWRFKPRLRRCAVKHFLEMALCFTEWHAHCIRVWARFLKEKSCAFGAMVYCVGVLFDIVSFREAWA